MVTFFLKKQTVPTFLTGLRLQLVIKITLLQIDPYWSLSNPRLNGDISPSKYFGLQSNLVATFQN
jgi:hypothetical protein